MTTDTNDYLPQVGIWTLTAPDGRYWRGMTPLAATRAEMNERVPAAVQMARINAAVAEEEAQDSSDIASLQARVSKLSAVLEHATHLNSFREFNDFIPTMRAALAAAGR